MRSRAGESDELQTTTTQRPDSYVVATHRNVAFIYWMSEASPEAVRHLEQTFEQLEASYPRGFSAVHVVKKDIPLPGPETRKELTRSMRRFATKMGCLAVVMLGSGFWASALQSIVTGIRMLAPMGDVVLRITSDAASLRGWYVAEHAARTGEVLHEPLLLGHIAQIERMGEDLLQTPERSLEVG